MRGCRVPCGALLTGVSWCGDTRAAAIPPRPGDDMETTPQTQTSPETFQAPEPELSDREIQLAIADELSGIRTALVSALQLVCSVPPFKGALGVTEDGELYPLNREQRRAAK